MTNNDNSYFNQASNYVASWGISRENGAKLWNSAYTTGSDIATNALLPAFWSVGVPLTLGLLSKTPVGIIPQIPKIISFAYIIGSAVYRNTNENPNKTPEENKAENIKIASEVIFDLGLMAFGAVAYAINPVPALLVTAAAQAVSDAVTSTNLNQNAFKAAIISTVNTVATEAATAVLDATIANANAAITTANQEIVQLKDDATAALTTAANAALTAATTSTLGNAAVAALGLDNAAIAAIRVAAKAGVEAEVAPVVEAIGNMFNMPIEQIAAPVAAPLAAVEAAATAAAANAAPMVAAPLVTEANTAAAKFIAQSKTAVIPILKHWGAPLAFFTMEAYSCYKGESFAESIKSDITKVIGSVLDQFDDSAQN